jgi:hypothetical protein
VSHRQGWAYSGVAIGGAVSVLANVAHSYVRPEDAPADWSPQMGAVASSVFWPVALFIALEILVRTEWPRHWLWVAVKVCGLLPIAAVAAVVSYQHLSGLLGSYNESGFAATFGPVAVDGLMVISSAALLAGSIAASRAVVADPVATQVSEPATTIAPVADSSEVAVDLNAATVDVSEVEPVAAVSFHRPRAVAAETPRRSQMTATTTPTRREKGPCVDGCDRHDSPVSYDTRRRCADRLAASATA